jgi:signal recognition particle receptor subunit beta
MAREDSLVSHEHAFEAPLDHESSWGAYPVEAEFEPIPTPEIEEPPAHPVTASQLQAGQLTRGRRRDLEAGTTALETLKIVYWGPGRCGKTTNLKWLHGRLRPELRGQFIDLDTPGERTLYFDLLPVNLAPAGAPPVQLRLYTVPGQPRHRLTRKLVLEDVDAVVFVMDSRARRLTANLASLIELRETIAEMGLEWADLPRVVQYNKLDLPDRIPPDELDHVLERMGERVPRFQAIATQGTGVLETLGAITTAAVRRHQRRVETDWMSAGGAY